MGSMEAQVKQYGITEVYKGKNPIVDIVFVHGLNGHPYKTWTSEKKPHVFWPVDLLPSAVSEDDVRVLTYGYNANVAAFSDGASKDRVHNHGESLIAQLHANRSIRKAKDRPIIFIAHSLGGLIVKRGLIYSESIQHVNTEHLRSIYVSTFALIFLATPHLGSDQAKMGSALQSITHAVFPKKMMDSSGQLLSALQTQSETLQNINRLFMDLQSRFRIYYFHESLPMSLGVTRDFIVEEYSAAPTQDGVERMGIEADHSSICKFASESSPGFEAVAEGIQRYTEEAPITVKRRWLEERSGRDIHRKGMIESLGGHVSPDDSDTSKGKGPAVHGYESMVNSTNSLPPMITPPSLTPNLTTSVTTNASIPPVEPDLQPLFITPPGFRPNSLFFGMTTELSYIHDGLFGLKPRENGPVAVLLHGVSGCGKSHIARQYMYDKRDKFPGGVFWIDAKSREAHFKCLWDIAQAASLQDGSLPEEMKDDTKFVNAVVKWFESREAWLIIFDGVSFDNDDEITDFRKFVPVRPNCSIIYTSVNRNLTKKFYLLNPISITVRPLGLKDALEMLFRELDIEHPSNEQTDKATELVKYLQCQPLAIHATGHRLSATRKPIETYRIQNYSTDQRLAEPYLGIMADLKEYKHFEALNLIFLLSFFGHNVPVAMLQMGKKALTIFKIEIKSSQREGGSRRDLDSTFEILIKYGLIDRELSPYGLDRSGTARSYSIAESSYELANSGMKQSKASSEQDSPHAIDILKVHTVVQGFFRDELKESSDFYHWLEVASRVFCLSFRTADKAIRSQQPQGLVKDYREYETHGGRLALHYPVKEHRGTSGLRLAKAELMEVMGHIKIQIQKRSPSSSQEAIREQVSIFDRTSSMSSAAEFSPSNLSRQSTFGLEKLPTESPVREGFGLTYDTGYESSEDSVLGATTMTPGLSHDVMPERPSVPHGDGISPGQAHGLSHPRPNNHVEGRDLVLDGTPAPDEADDEDEDGWQKIPRISRPAFYRAARRHQGWRDVGDFRPIPGVDLQTLQAQGSLTRPRSDSGNKATARSDAEASLARIHATSPPPPRGGLGPRDRSKGVENVPTYAHVASGQVISSRSTSPFPAQVSPPKRPTLSRDPSRDTLRSKSGNITPSPLATEFRPNEPRFMSDSVPGIENQNYYSTSSPPSEFSRKRYSDTSLPALQERYLQDQGQGQYTIPSINGSSLPYDENIPISRIRGRPLERGRIAPAIPMALTAQGIARRTEGYGSVPMSRDASGQSHNSLQTEPVRYPPYNSSLLGSSPPNRISPHHSPHTSPRPAQRRPVLTSIDSRTAQTHAMNLTLGMGEWAQTPVSPDAPPRSRGDSGHSAGPGIFVDTDGHGRTFVGFTSPPLNAAPPTPQNHLRFGAHDPINIDEARQRASEHQTRIDEWRRDFEKGVYRKPYPNVNLIPTASDLTAGRFEEMMRSPPLVPAAARSRVLERRVQRPPQLGMGRSSSSIDPGMVHGLGLNVD